MGQTLWRKILLRLSLEHLAAIDAYRNQQPQQTSRTAVIREAVVEFLQGKYASID